MKRLLIILTVLGLGLPANAQVSNNALGLRVYGDGSFNGAEISYQHRLKTTNRLEMDLSFGTSPSVNRLFLVGMYHWTKNIDGGLNWFIGPGASVSFDNYDNSDSYINIGLGGQIGLEYNLNAIKAPFLVSIDVRPIWDFLGDHAGIGWGAALGIRYTW